MTGINIALVINLLEVDTASRHCNLGQSRKKGLPRGGLTMFDVSVCDRADMLAGNGQIFGAPPHEGTSDVGNSR
ncbi:hypothetical protein [Burkholderia anthina]|uniref:hypothetical protein n=1 Tax=Burkholderia anthina TaxID=179879 RepID=UPI0037BFC99E